MEDIISAARQPNFILSPLTPLYRYRNIMNQAIGARVGYWLQEEY